MKTSYFKLLVILLILAISCSEDNFNTDKQLQHAELIQKTPGDCFTDGQSNNKGALDNTVEHIVKDNKLTLKWGINYNCCASLNDNVVIEGNKIKIYVDNTCEGDDCFCYCTCYFSMDYEFDINPDETYYYFVFVENELTNEMELLGSGCTKPTTDIPVYQLDETFKLKKNTTCIIKDTGLEVELLDINDSRCPEGVQCVRAGEAVVKIEVKGINGENQTITLAVPDADTDYKSVAEVGGFTITLLNVYPYPSENDNQDTKTQWAELIVSKKQQSESWFQVVNVYEMCNDLYVTVSYSGGCIEHYFDLDVKPDANGTGIFYLYHKSEADPCDGIITQELRFNLSEYSNYVDNTNLVLVNSSNNIRQQVQTVDCDTALVINDPFELKSAKLNGTQINILVAYSGGCAEHEFELIYDPNQPAITIYPPQIVLKMYHNSNGDMCEAYPSEEVLFDLVDIVPADILQNEYEIIVVNASDNQSVKAQQ